MISVKISKGRNIDRLMSGKLVRDLEKGFDPTMEKIGKAIKLRTKYHLNGRVLNVRSGDLRNSIDFAVKKIKHGYITFIGSIKGKYIPYARIHEEGGRAGRNGSAKIPKRPYLSRALVDKKVLIRREIKKWVRKSIRG